MRKSRLFNWSWDNICWKWPNVAPFWSRHVTQLAGHSARFVNNMFRMDHGRTSCTTINFQNASCNARLNNVIFLYTANHMTWWYSEMILTPYFGFQTLPFCLQRHRIMGITIWLDPIWANPAPERSFLTTKNLWPVRSHSWKHMQNQCKTLLLIYVPRSKLLILGMVIPPLIGNPYNGYINPGLMSLSPTKYGKQWEFRSDRTYIFISFYIHVSIV